VGVARPVENAKLAVIFFEIFFRPGQGDQIVNFTQQDNLHHRVVVFVASVRTDIFQPIVKIINCKLRNS
jgi:hypothetical protein